MASEVHSLVLELDMAFTLYHLISETTGTKPGIEAYVDCKNYLDIILKQIRTSQKRL